MIEPRDWHRDWLVWAYMGLLIAILCVSVKLLTDSMWMVRQMRTVQKQAVIVEKKADMSEEDRAVLHDRQDQTVKTLDRLDERSDYLDKTVRGLIAAEQARQERRKTEEAGRKRP